MMLGPLKNSSQRILLKAQNIEKLQNAGITGRAARGGPIVRPKPFPYREKRYGVIQGFYDKTSWRFDDNSKIVVVDGPIASGKTSFAKSLAEELDMLHLRAVTMDDMFINEYGYDLRKLNSKLPESVQLTDEKDFLLNPKHQNTALFQIHMLILKISQFIDAVAHLLNTGQGVVLERSCFGDHIFMEAMCNAGHISKGARSVYNNLRELTLPRLVRPHLVIYLDVPVSRVIENIQKRSVNHEVKSKVLTPEYLADIEKLYKEMYLPDVSINSELLVYDWSTGGDAEVVVEDIERIDFDRFGPYDKKMKHWRFGKEWDLCEMRIEYTTAKNRFMDNLLAPRIDVPELIASGEDIKTFDDALEAAPGERYAKGFNFDMGDGNGWFKTKIPRKVSPWFR